MTFLSTIRPTHNPLFPTIRVWPTYFIIPHLSDPPFDIFLNECFEILSDWLLSRLNVDSLSAPPEAGDVSASLQLRGDIPKILTGLCSPDVGERWCGLVVVVVDPSVWHSLSAEFCAEFPFDILFDPFLKLSLLGRERRQALRSPPFFASLDTWNVQRGN